MTIGKLCNRDVVVARGDISVAEAAQLMRSSHVGDLVVMDDSEERKPIGLITDRDIVVEVVAAGLDPSSVTVVDIMTESLEVANEDDDFWEALTHMSARGVRRLPIVDGQGKLAGLFTLDDAVTLIGEATTTLATIVNREIEHEERKRRDL